MNGAQGVTLTPNTQVSPKFSNGRVIRKAAVFVSDVLEKKTDLVIGKYELPASQGKTTVAVKIVDMLGEELLITKEV
jgi:hypothetical protein